MAKKIDANGVVWKQNKKGFWVNTETNDIVDSAKKVPALRKQRNDKANARVWRLGMPLDNCCVTSAVGPVHPVLYRLRGESLKLKSTVQSLDADTVQSVQQALYNRLDVVQGLTIIQRQQVLSTIQQLSSPTLSYIPVCWEEFRHCAELAVSAVESKHSYFTELLSIDTILDEQLRQEVMRSSELDVTVLTKYIPPERLDIDVSELPF